jgi:hypothetical protein
MNSKIFIQQLFFKNDNFVYEDMSEEEFEKNEDKTFYPIMIQRQDVERGHLKTYVDALTKVEKKKNKAQGSVALVFKGYDSDSREIFEIKEIRNWMSRMLKLKPHLFYYLTDLEDNSRFMFFCIAELDNHGYQIDELSNKQQVSVKLTGNAKGLIEKLTENAVSYSKSIKDPLVTQFHIANYVLKCTAYDSIRSGSDNSNSSI